MKIQTTRLPHRVQSKLSSSAWLTISYLALSIVWIMLGDSLAAEVSGNDKVLYEKIQSLKGIFFILVSAVFLYLFSRKLYLGIELSHLQTESVQKKYQALNEAASIHNHIDASAHIRNTERKVNQLFQCPSHHRLLIRHHKCGLRRPERWGFCYPRS